MPDTEKPNDSLQKTVADENATSGESAPPTIAEVRTPSDILVSIRDKQADIAASLASDKQDQAKGEVSGLQELFRELRQSLQAFATHAENLAEEAFHGIEHLSDKAE